MIAFRKPALVAVLCLTALGACVQSGTGPNNTQIGVATGAAIGGLIGANADSDNPRTATAAAAAIGAVVGGAIGAQLDRQKAELDQGFTNDIDVINTGSELIVRMPNGILFDIDSAALRPQVQSDLNVLSGNLLRYPNSTIFVVGHTDNTGSAAHNQQLSQRRAQSVASVLIAGGVNPGRIVASGRGEDQPIASNLTPEGRQQNRRVDITIRPNQ
jgi:outer membrane protein OmpA-like peptidoglycan-associated protein